MSETRNEVIVYTDGASRGNPGPAAAGFILTNTSGKQLRGKAFFLGQSTNNVSEYTAIVRAIETAKELGTKKLKVFSDSELLVRQINGQYKVKSEQIRPLFTQVIDMLEEFDDWEIQHVMRDKNKEADKLVNRALDMERDVELKTIGRGRKKNRHQSKGIRLGMLISGGGTTMFNILEQIKEGKVNAEIAVVISSRSNVAGVERAKKAGLDVKVVRRKDYPDVDEFSRKIEKELLAANVELVVQGGWLCLWKIPERYENRVMNIHPALLPSFGGQGMWGHHVHEAVIAKGCKVSGCTVHFCTNEYDKGPIIVQRSCEVKESDTPDTLAERVFGQECIAYPEAIRLFVENRITVQDGRVLIVDKNEKRG